MSTELTEAERAELLQATHFSHKTCEHIAPAVERIAAARVAEVERERDEARGETRYARSQRDEERRAKEGNWRALGEWSTRAKRAEAEVRTLRERLARVGALIEATAVCTTHDLHREPGCEECVKVDGVTEYDAALRAALADTPDRGAQDVGPYESADCTCGHPYAEHKYGVCQIPGCRCDR